MMSTSHNITQGERLIGRFFFMYSMVNHIKMYASLVSTVLESICDNMAVKKSDDLSPKSCIFRSKQPCANTKIRLLATYY